MKKVIGVDKNKQKYIVLTPDISIYRFIKNEHFNYLDIFYYFGQKIIKNPKRKNLEDVKLIMLDLCRRVEQARHQDKEVKKFEKKILKNKKLKNIMPYKTEHIFMASIEAYLNTVHSINDLLINIDQILDSNLRSKYLGNQEWFKIQMDFRNLCHHNETPLFTVEKNAIIFNFERLDLLKYPKYFKKEKKSGKNKISVEFTSTEVFSNLLLSLNRYSKGYLKKVKQTEYLDAITGFHENGRFKTKRVNFSDLMVIAEKNIKK